MFHYSNQFIFDVYSSLLYFKRIVFSTRNTFVDVIIPYHWPQISLNNGTVFSRSLANALMVGFIYIIIERCYIQLIKYQ